MAGAISSPSFPSSPSSPSSLAVDPQATPPQLTGGVTEVVVLLSPRAFRMCWHFLIAYHLFNACFAALMAFVHVMASTPAIYPNMWMLAINQHTLMLSGWTYVAIAVVQLVIVGLHVAQSLRRRELSFGYDDDDSDDNMDTAHQLKTTTRLWRSPTYRWRTRSDTFEVLFQLRQLIEILLQTYQANQLSRSVARRDLQLVVVASVVANCVHTPLYDWYTARHRHPNRGHRHPSHRRHYHPRQQSALRLVVLSAVDIALDFLVAVGLPIAILVPRLAQFDFAHSHFPIVLTYDDVWNTRAINEGRQVLVSSVVDYVSSISPHVLGLLGLRFIKSRLRRRRPRHMESNSTQTSTRTSTRTRTSRVTPSPNVASILSIYPRSHHVPAASTSTSTSTSVTRVVRMAAPRDSSVVASGVPMVATTRTSTASNLTTSRRWTVLVVQLMHLVAVLWAVLVLSLHTRAQHGHDRIEGCQVVFPAWLAKHAPCAALQFNCHARGKLAGTANEIHEALAQMERSVLRLVVFSHCPALEIPPILVREFPKLNVLAVFNSTIHKWDVAASLSRVWTPLLSQLQFVDTNMTTIPQGLLHEELPRVVSLVMFGSNLSSLPSDIGNVWRDVWWTTLWLEYTQLTELPESFCELQVTKLSLEGSPVTQLPAQIFNTSTDKSKALSLVRLSRTQIQSLPLAMHDTSSLAIFLADHTNVTHVPEWLRTWAATSHVDMGNNATQVVSLADSPVCTLDHEGAQNAALCQVVDPSKCNLLPYDVIAAQRPLVSLG